MMLFQDGFFQATSHLCQLPSFFMPTIFTVIARSTICSPLFVPDASSPRCLYPIMSMIILIFLACLIPHFPYLYVSGIWKDYVSCIIFLAENSPSVLIFNVDSQPLASSLLSRNCLTLVIMKSGEVNVNCIFAPVLYKSTLLKLMKTKVPTDPVVPSTNWCQCRVILTSRWHRPCESTPWCYISYIHAWHFLGFKSLCLWCPSSSPSDCWILTHILPVSSLSESKNFPKNLTVLLIFWDWWNNLVSYFKLLSGKYFLQCFFWMCDVCENCRQNTWPASFYK